MKLISLNTYGGHFFEPLMEFVKKQAVDTDFFCFQEMLSTPDGKPVVSNGARGNLFSEIKNLLPDFDGYFAPTQDFFDLTTIVSIPITQGVATFVKKKYVVREVGDFFIYSERNSFVPRDFSTLGHNMQYVQVEVAGKPLTVCTVHGTSEPGNKLDTEARLAQSTKILDFVKQQPGETIISGDFNLLPNTKSINLFEEDGFRNLIKDFSITTTRGTLLKQLHPEYGTSSIGWQEFADYTFVSRGVSVKKFEVPDLPLSDHLPLIMEFEV